MAGRGAQRGNEPPVLLVKWYDVTKWLLERIDMHIEVPAVPYRELRSSRDGAESRRMREQVLAAREVQRERFGHASTTLNGTMGPRALRKHCTLDEAGEAILRQATTELGLSARAHDKVLRVSRTIADLAGEERITAGHVGEAIQYRRLDRQF